MDHSPTQRNSISEKAELLARKTVQFTTTLIGKDEGDAR